MLETMLTQTRSAYDSYWTSKRIDWILKWPQQIVLLVARMAWTKEVRLLVFILFSYVENFSKCH